MSLLISKLKMMSTQTEEPKAISLFFQEGSSDKQYDVSLEKSGTGWLVNFKYGRRGNVNNTGSKTPGGPVSYELASKTYHKLVQEKMGKGYQPDKTAATSFR